MTFGGSEILCLSVLYGIDLKGRLLCYGGGVMRTFRVIECTGLDERNAIRRRGSPKLGNDPHSDVPDRDGRNKKLQCGAPRFSLMSMGVNRE